MGRRSDCALVQTNLRNFIQDNSQDVSAIVNSKFPGIVQCGEVDMDGKSVRPGQNLLEALSVHRK